MLSVSSQQRQPSLLLLRLLLLLSHVPSILILAQTDPSRLNGGSCLAMAGKDCVALILDSRFGSGTSLVNVEARHVLIPPRPFGGGRRQQQQNDNNNLFVVALQGLQGDVLELEHVIATALQHHGYARGGWMTGSGSGSTLSLLSDDGETTTNTVSSTLSPRSLASWTSHLLYQRKKAPYYVEPMIVGLERRRLNDDGAWHYRPYLCSMDLLGSLQEQPPLQQSATAAAGADDDNDSTCCDYSDEEPPTFCCMGAAVPSLYGTAQAFWKPDMTATELIHVCTKAFLAALERDCLSGYGARLYLLTPEQGITVHDVITRND